MRQSPPLSTAKSEGGSRNGHNPQLKPPARQVFAQKLSPALIAIVISCCVLLPVCLFGQADVEETPQNIMPSYLMLRQILSGHLPIWTNAVAFGMPMPSEPHSLFNPMFWIYALLPHPIGWQLFLLVQLAVGIFYVLKLAIEIGASWKLGVLAAVTFAFSSPTVMYAYSDDWPSRYVSWTLLPVAFFYARALLLDCNRRVWNFLSVTFVFVLVGMNCPAGYIPIVYTVLFGYLVLGTGLDVKRLITIGVIGLICLAALSDRILLLFSELQLSPLGVPRFQQGGFSFSDLAGTLVRPLDWNGFPYDALLQAVRRFDSATLFQVLLNYRASPRPPFLGMVFIIAAFVSAAKVLFATQNSELRAMALMFWFCIIGLILPESTLPLFMSTSWGFRDPFVLIAIVMALPTLHALPIGWRKSASGFQCLQLFATAVPFFFLVYHSYVAGATHRGIFEPPSVFATWLKANTEGGRILLSEEVEQVMQRVDPELKVIAPVHLTQVGLVPINGRFRGVSFDVLQPSNLRMYGFLNASKSMLDNKPLLDFLAIKYVLMRAGETLTSAQQIHLSVLARFETKTGRQFVLYRNATAYSEAVLLKGDDIPVSLPHNAGCPHDRLLCGHVSSLSDRFISDLAVEVQPTRIKLSVPRASDARLVVISILMRSGWTATLEGKRMPVSRFADAFLAIQVPPDGGHLIVAYRPSFRLALLAFPTGLLILGGIILLCRSIWLLANGESNGARSCNPWIPRPTLPCGSGTAVAAGGNNGRI